MAVRGGGEMYIPKWILSILAGFLISTASGAWAEMPVIETWVAPDIECPIYHEAEGCVTKCLLPSSGDQYQPMVLLYGQPALYEFHYHNTGPYGYPPQDPLDVTPLLKAMPLDARLPNGEWMSPEDDIFGYLDTPTIVPPGHYYVALIDLTEFIGTNEIGSYEIIWGTHETGRLGAAFEICGPSAYYARHLEPNFNPEQWGLALYGETGEIGEGRANEVISLGPRMVYQLTQLLANTNKYKPLGGDGPDDPFQIYQWRVCDFAGIILTEIWGQPPGVLRSQDPAERDKRLAELQAYYRLHEQEFKEQTQR